MQRITPYVSLCLAERVAELGAGVVLEKRSKDSALIRKGAFPLVTGSSFYYASFLPSGSYSIKSDKVHWKVSHSLNNVSSFVVSIFVSRYSLLIEFLLIPDNLIKSDISSIRCSAMSFLKFNSIGNSLQQFIGHRVNEITEYLMATNSTYKTLSNQCTQHFIQIQEYLPSDLQQTMLQYEETLLLLQAVIENHIYTQGLKDGMDLRSLLK